MAWYTLLDEKIANYLPDMAYEKDVPLARHISFRVGGSARRIAFPKNGEQLILLLTFAADCGARPFVMGNGTNLLFPDEGVERLVVCTKEMNDLTLGEDGSTVRADCGVSLARLATFACQHGLAGLEFAHGIPGSVGGGIYMNAGAYGGELCQVAVETTALLPDGSIWTAKGEAQGFSYRHSAMQEKNALVLHSRFRLTPGDPARIVARMRELAERRRGSQPLELPSAGSTFKRPVGGYAAALIDSAGLKGRGVGRAAVSEKHAGFVVNLGGATAADVLATMELVQRRVYEESGIRLEPEVRIW